MVVADLHVHTTNSDGSLTLETLPAAAEDADVSAVAITDHDRLHPELSTPVATIGGVTVVHGIELRVAADELQVDLLGYGARRTPALEALIQRLQADRIERGREIIARVEDRLGVELPVESRAGLGRPHIAEAIAAVSEYDYADAFEELIGDGCPCYVPRAIPQFSEGVDVLAGACGLVSLAHPYRYDDVGAALELCSELDAVERLYPYGREVDPRPIERAMERYDLIATGGSDAHGETLGLAGLDADAYRRFRAAL
ncbi:MAG: PHP domain-containing protein [Halobacteriota archaeon]|uniref:PHP domain-containing protein n=1 Tax=Natronomonas sp. TaxID=2184060 RepID=UPI0039752BF3